MYSTYRKLYVFQFFLGYDVASFKLQIQEVNQTYCKFYCKRSAAPQLFVHSSCARLNYKKEVENFCTG